MDRKTANQVNGLVNRYGKSKVLEALEQMEREKKLEQRVEETLEIFRTKYFGAKH
jgi:hypothetical protein